MIVLWPVYFDSALTYGEGRRVPKMLAMRAPKTEDIVKAAVASGLKAELQPNVAHPRYPWNKTGYVLVATKEPKTKILKLIAGKLPHAA
jgi:signal recognition particle subunit SEC65